MDHDIVGGVERIPRYDADLTLAMGALEEYCEKRGCTFTIKKNRLNGYLIEMFPTNYRNERFRYNVSLPTAICESIVEHAEGAK